MDWEETFRKALRNKLKANAPKNVTGRFIENACKYAVDCMKDTMDALAEDEEGSSDGVVVAVDEDGIPYAYDFPWDKIPERYIYCARDFKEVTGSGADSVIVSEVPIENTHDLGSERADWWPISGHESPNVDYWNTAADVGRRLERLYPKWWCDLEPSDSLIRRPPGL